MIDNRLITFLTLLEEKNYTRTANKLYITQPAVTHHIKSLENEYNITLFLDSKTFKLTTAGNILYEYALRIKEENELLINTISKANSSMLDKYAITPSSFSMIRYKDELKELYRSIINNELSIIDSQKLFNDISAGRIDFGIIDNSFDSSIFESIQICSERINVVVSSNGSFKNKDRITREHLNSYPIIFPDDLSGIYNSVAQALKNKNIKVKSKRIIYSNSPTVVADIINSIDGVGFMYQSAAIHFEKEGLVKRIELLNFTPCQNFYLIYNKITSHRENLNSIIEILRRINE